MHGHICSTAIPWPLKPFNPFSLFVAQEQNVSSAWWSLGCHSERAPPSWSVKITAGLHQPSTQWVSYQQRARTRKDEKCLQRELIVLNFHNIYIYGILRSFTRLVDLARSVVNYFQTFELENNVSFLAYWTSEIARHIGFSCFILNAIMKSCCFYIWIAKRIWKTTTFHLH